ncbi:hypothetical protein [Streptomyces sp. NPDC001508]|uniref:hypothetical protein n=1 Tax=Streptomyces sp. NPDC001508 TaxID=3154656 RepID=UPI003329B34C
MKFTDGYWLLREGVTAAHPVEVLDVTAAGDTPCGGGTLEIHAPTRPVRHRGDLLTGPVVTISVHAPLPDVIGITFTHFEGGQPRTPRFEVRRQKCAAQVSYDDEHALLTSGTLSARVARTGPWRVDFLAGGRTLTGSGAKGMGIMRDATGAHYLREQLDLRVGTGVYGLGERFGPLVKNGQVVDIWNADGGTATEQAYKNAPFYLTDAGYGVFVDHPGKVSFEVGSESVSRVQFSVESQQLTYYVIHGPDLLVAPVFSDEGDVTYYVPEGTWTRFADGRTVTGPRWVRERHGFLSVPLLVRPGAVIPVGAVDDRPDYDHADGVTLRAFRPARGAPVTVRVGDMTFTVVREGDTLRASAGDPSRPWALAAGERTARAGAGTGFLTVELG